VLPADGAGTLVASGIEETAETESMSTGDSGRPVEGIHADWTANILDLSLHLLFTTKSSSFTISLSYQSSLLFPKSVKK